MILCFSLSVGLYIRTVFENDFPKAICVTSQIVRSGPGEQYIELDRLVTGSKVRFKRETNEKREQWVQVRFGSGRTGWLIRKQLVVL